MKRAVLQTMLGVVGLCLSPWGPLLAWQEAPPTNKAKAKASDIVGIWSQVYSETDGDASDSMTNPGGRLGYWRGQFFHLPAYVWRFSKEELGSDYDGPKPPSFRKHYQLNAGGEMGAIDMIPLDEKGKKIETAREKGIFLLKDEILMICFAYDGGPRPKGFTTSEKSKSRLVILRRGKVK